MAHFPKGLQISGDQYDDGDSGDSPLAGNQYEKGVAKLKSEMRGVYDASGKEHPTSPHYSESQDATSLASKAVRPNLTEE